jgi:type IV pilus assembly protein PilE
MRKLKMYKAVQGFTLIELIVTVAIIGILLKIALPGYNSSIMQSRRTAAKTALLDLASREARYYSTNNAYTATLANLGYGNYTAGTGTGATPSISLPLNGSGEYYDLTVVINGASTTFTGTATAVNSQASDGCGNYTLDNFGNQQANGQVGATANGINCW